jgi:hypothetical protein
MSTAAPGRMVNRRKLAAGVAILTIASGAAAYVLHEAWRDPRLSEREFRGLIDSL